MTSWPGFEVQTEERPDALWLIAAGELDIAQADRVEAELDEAAAAGRPLVVDLTAVTFCDSSGLAALLHARRRHPQLRYVPGEAVLNVAQLGCVEDMLFGSGPATEADVPGEDAASS